MSWIRTSADNRQRVYNPTPLATQSSCYSIVRSFFINIFFTSLSRCDSVCSVLLSKKQSPVSTGRRILRALRSLRSLREREICPKRNKGYQTEQSRPNSKLCQTSCKGSCPIHQQPIPNHKTKKKNNKNSHHSRRICSLRFASSSAWQEARTAVLPSATKRAKRQGRELGNEQI